MHVCKTKTNQTETTRYGNCLISDSDSLYKQVWQSFLEFAQETFCDGAQFSWRIMEDMLICRTQDIKIQLSYMDDKEEQQKHRGSLQKQSRRMGGRIKERSYFGKVR